MSSSLAAPSSDERLPGLLVIGGGPAGLMAAEAALAQGVAVTLWEAKGSVGRKFLIAGRGGLNLTHSEPPAGFHARYGEGGEVVSGWLQRFPPQQLRDWAAGLGIETFIGSSGRVFPRDFKAAPMLRQWLRRLRSQGLRIEVRQRLRSLQPHPAGGYTLEADTSTGVQTRQAAAVLLALGGGSWPQLGSDGRWVPLLEALGIPVTPLQASNSGFEADWSARLREQAGAPLKPVVLHWRDPRGEPRQRQGECVLSEQGLEGGVLYAASADLRQQLRAEGEARIWLDLCPGRTAEQIRSRLASADPRRSLGERLRRGLHLDAAKCALFFECRDAAPGSDPAALAAQLKALPIRLRAQRPLAEAISSAGGVVLGALDEGLQLKAHPGLFLAGEMLDWDAPTGGYLLSACFASGVVAGQAAARWLLSRQQAAKTRL
ncbi:MAG TPA: TIGR03862 family flavoprotein [Nevskiaceae bacterium]|nr:TIGR03862 family flavoprotein [Nevskiaceae bacterium]